MKPPEDALIRRARSLESGALAELYDRYFDGIYGYLYARLRHREDAEDLTEQVFLRMVDAIPNYRPRGVAFSSWLYRIAHNLLVDRYRRAGKEPVALLEHVRDGDADSDPEAYFQRSDERRRLWEAIQLLTPEQRQVITLRFIDGLDVPVVARVMGRREGAIHAMQHRALRSLQRIMERREMPAEVRRA